MHDFSLRHLSDAAVEQELSAATSADRRSIVVHLARIAEFDHRRLYLAKSCASMYRYCVDRLRMSEDAAVQRIRAARTALEYPAIFSAIADGRLNLSTVVLVSGRLTQANAAELLAAVEHKTFKQVRRLLADRFGHPRPTFFPSGTPAARAAAGESVAAGTADLPVAQRVEIQPHPSAISEAPLPQSPVEGPAAGPPWRRARLTPVGPGVSELVVLLGEEACAQLEASRDLLGHAVPSGDLAEVLERAIALQYAHLRRRRCGASSRSGAGAGKGARAVESSNDAAPSVPRDPRHVPNAVRREVWERDGGQCTFVDADGRRCEERFRVELDHVVPVARGGCSTVENLRLLCRAHNQLAAERAFGRQRVRARSEAAQRARIGERLRRQAERERAEHRKQEIERQREELGEAFRQLGYRGADLERALAICASRPEAPLEERLKHALGCMAPRVRKESPAPSEQSPQTSNEAA